ncbi:MAG: M16 family metallopeptidase, partial [Shimia sp.]
MLRTTVRTAAAIVLAALAPAALAQTAIQEDVTTFTLDNGLQAVVIEDTRAPVVVHMLYYRAGAADEPPGKSGVAHFLEHLMFKATDELESGEFSAIVAANGGTDNAFVTQDFTGYVQRVAADRLGLMMEMEADRMVDIAFTEQDVETERGVIIEERNQRTDSSPGGIFGEQRTAAQFLAHPYGTPVIGWRHEIEALEIDDIYAFHRAHYAPNNAVLVVAGDVDPAEVRALAETHYGPIPANPAIAERARPQEPPQRAPRHLEYRDARVGNPVFVRTYLAPERDAGAQEEAAALTMLAAVLGGSSATSVLGEAIQFGSKNALYTSAFYGGQSLDDTRFGLVGVPAPGVTLSELEAEFDQVIADFIEEGVDPADLDRIKA